MNIKPQTAGSWLALLATLAGLVTPLLPPQYQLAGQIIVGALGSAAVKLP
jgi:hypothetical protein